MKLTRRDFVKTSSLTGLALTGGCTLRGASRQLEKAHVQRFNMSGYAAPSLDKVRVAIIGLGQRGPAHMNILRHIEGVEIKALCDSRPEKANAAKGKLTGTAHNPDVLTGAEDWKRQRLEKSLRA
jgi:anaerobic selenocysteine-containing dehydrogenase